MTMTHQRSGWSITNNGEMTVSTPFDGYRLSKWSWSHENSANKWKCHHELDVQSQQFIVDIDANHHETRGVRRLSANFAFHTPANIASWLQNLNAVVDYQHDMHAWKTSGRTNFRWGQYAFGHEHDVDIEPYTAVVTTAKLSTPFSGFEQLGIGLNNRRTGNSWRANNEILMGHIGNVTLDGSLNYSGYNFESMIRVTTPISHVERIVVNVRNTQQHDATWASHADIQFASDKTASFDSKISLGRQRMIELKAMTPFSFLRQMTYKASYTGTWRSFQASTELQHNMLGPEKISAMMSVDAANLYRVNGRLMIRTPFDEFSLLRVAARHIQDSNEHVTTTVSWQLNQFQGSLLQDVTARSWTDFDSRYEIEYLNNRKIELMSSFHLDPKIVATATLRTPCEHARLISFSLNQEGPLNNFELNSELLFNNHKLTKTLQFYLHQNTLTINGNIETPFMHLRSLTYNISHNGDWRNFQNNVIVAYNGQEITGSSEFNAGVLKFEFHTPWRALRSYNLQHTNKPGHSFVGWINSWSAELDGKRIFGGSECNWDGNQLGAHIVWNLPEEYSIRISHTGRSVNQFSNNAIVKLAGDEITGAMEFQRTTDKIDFQLNMASTFRGYERMEAVFKHEPSDNGFTTTATISTSLHEFPRMSTQLTYQRNENQLSSQLRAQLPFEAVRRLVVSLNHRGNPGEFSTSLTASVNDKTVTSRLTFKNNPRMKEGTLSLQTPFNGYDRFHASFAFNGELQHFTASSTVRLPFDGYERFHAELTHNGNWRSFRTSGKIETNIANLQTASFNVEHTAASWTQLKTMATVNVPSGRFSAKFAHSGDVSDFRTNLEIRTPFSGYSIFGVGIEHEHLDTVKTAVSVQTPIHGYENYSLSLLKAGDVRNLQLKAEMTSSVRNLEQIAVSWNHSVARQSFTTNLLIETSIPGYSKFGALLECSSSQRNWRWSGSVETPIRGYEHWTASVEHAKDDRRNGFRTVVRMTSPINNYRNFGTVLSYYEQAPHFRAQLRVNLPFSEVPQIDVTFRHRGVSPRDFATSLSVEYAGKKIELETAYRMAVVQSTEINYEGSLRLAAPCRYVRDFSITVSHNCKPEVTTGALKVMLNGDDKVSAITVATVIYYSTCLFIRSRMCKCCFQLSFFMFRPHRRANEDHNHIGASFISWS